MNDASLRASDCVPNEDSAGGVASSGVAGLRTVGVTSSYDAAELSQADLIIPPRRTDLGELHRLLS
jgi:beta-phosphoglucomutase-like phosphatase (HAD superfamily)